MYLNQSRLLIALAASLACSVLFNTSLLHFPVKQNNSYVQQSQLNNADITAIIAEKSQGRTQLCLAVRQPSSEYNEVLFWFCSELKLNPADVHTAYSLNVLWAEDRSAILAGTPWQGNARFVRQHVSTQWLIFKANCISICTTILGRRI